MTKTAICADLHLNNSNFGRMDKAGLSFRTKDFIAAFEYFVEYCISTLKPDRIIILGDVYENPHPPNPVRRFLNRMLKRLSRAGIKVEILVGNHDSCYFSHALQPVEEADFRNVRVHYAANLLVEDDCAMIVLPHTQEIERRETSHKLLCREFGAANTAAIAKARADGLPVIALGHFGVFGVEMNDGILNREKADTSLEDLESLDADIVLLGHYHMDQELHVPGTVRSMYVGSLERSTFNDKAKEKSFVVVETEKGKPPVLNRIVYPGARPMLTITGTAEQIREQVAAIQSSMASEPIVKVKFVGTKSEHAEYVRNRKDIRDMLVGAKHVAFEKEVVDPEQVAKAEAVKRQIADKADVGVDDIVEIFRAYLEACVADEARRTGIMSDVMDVVKVVNDRDRKAKGITPGRTRIHGVRLHNFQRYGTERNVVEFDKGSSQFFGRIGFGRDEDRSIVREDASLFLSGLSKDDKRLISIVGKINGDENESNGAGKSSILDAISWAFYEKVVRDFFDKESTKGSSTTSVVRTIDGKPERECYVEVLFSSGQNLYLIRRERRFKPNGVDHTGLVMLYCLYSPDGVSDSGSMSGRRGADAEAFMDQLVSMDFDTFANSVMFGQSDADRFIRGTDKIRKEIFIKVLGLTIIDDYLQEARNRKNLVDKELANLEARMAALSSSMMSTDELSEAEAKAATLETDASQCEAKAEASRKMANDLRQDPVFARQGQLEAEASKYRALIQQRLEEARRASKASSDALAAEQVALEGHKRAARTAQRAVEDAKDSVASLERKIAGVDETALTGDIAMGEKARQAKPTREKERNALVGQKQDIKVEVSLHNGHVMAANTRIEKLKRALAKIGGKDEAPCPECESPVSRSHIDGKIKDIEGEVANHKKLIADKEAPLAEIDVKITEVDKRLANIEAYAEKGRKASISLGEHKANQSALTPAKERVTEAEARLVEANSRVEASEKLVESHKAAISSAQEEAAKDNQAHEKKIAAIEVLSREVERVVSEVNRKISTAEDEASQAAASAKAKSAERAGLLARIDVSRKTEAKVGDAKKEQLIKVETQGRLAIVEEGFGLDGIRVQIIEKYVPLLNVYVGEFMDAMSDAMSVTISTDGKREGKMAIGICGSSAADPRQLSKGQFARVKVAVDLGLGMMSLVRNENAPDFVCLDEVFAPVDVAGKKAMLDVVRKLQDFFRLVLVISHDPFIQDAIPSTIVVNQVSDVSMIERQAWES